VVEVIQSTEAYFTQVRDTKPTVMVFTADWCPDCTYLKTFIDDVAEQYRDGLSMYWVNRDEFGDLCETLEVLGIPSFIGYANGKVVSRFVNGKRKTRREVEEFLDDFLRKAV